MVIPVYIFMVQLELCFNIDIYHIWAITLNTILNGISDWGGGRC